MFKFKDILPPNWLISKGEIKLDVSPGACLIFKLVSLKKKKYIK